MNGDERVCERPLGVGVSRTQYLAPAERVSRTVADRSSICPNSHACAAVVVRNCERARIEYSERGHSEIASRIACHNWNIYGRARVGCVCVALLKSRVR